MLKTDGDTQIVSVHGEAGAEAELDMGNIHGEA